MAYQSIENYRKPSQECDWARVQAKLIDAEKKAKAAEKKEKK